MILEKRYLAIDYGKKRVGLAVGSNFPKAAGLLMQGAHQKDLVAQLIDKIESASVEGIVIGLPQLPSGDETILADEIKKLGAELAAQTHLPVFYEPEGYSSVEAEKSLAKNAAKGDKDQMAAVIILEQFLGHQSKTNSVPEANREESR